LQGRVDLSDVEGPHLARPSLELLSELQAVLRPLAQQRQQGMSDAHSHHPLSLIPSSILSILREGQETFHGCSAGGTERMGPTTLSAQPCPEGLAVLATSLAEGRIRYRSLRRQWRRRQKGGR